MLRYLQAIRWSLDVMMRRCDLNVIMSKAGWRAIFMSTVLAAGFALAAVPQGHAASQRLVVVVNDHPITDYDIDQRMRLRQALGASGGSETQQRKAALQELIDDVIKQAEAKRNKIEPNEQQVSESIERMAQNIGTTSEGLANTLKSKGVSMNTLKQFVKASIAFNWIASRQYNVKVDVEPSEVDRRLASIQSDPRFKPVTVYELQEISLPVEQMGEAMMGQLLQARAVEAQQFMQRFDGCKNTRAAASGIFNVQITDVIQVAAGDLPADMRQALDEVGTGKLLGPMRSAEGVQVVAFCGRKTVEPPKPSREVVENMLRNEKHEMASQRILRDLRRSAYIDYKDPSLTQ
jgi:peptidyl-prolyl cis-trans isomerase SurA